MLVTTTPTIEGGRITRYYGIVSGETIIGANVFRDFFASIRDVVGGRSGSYEEVLREAKDIALREMYGNTWTPDRTDAKYAKLKVDKKTVITSTPQRGRST